jgi:hypothetical protein
LRIYLSHSHSKTQGSISRMVLLLAGMHPQIYIKRSLHTLLSRGGYQYEKEKTEGKIAQFPKASFIHMLIQDSLFHMSSAPVYALPEARVTCDFHQPHCAQHHCAQPQPQLQSNLLFPPHTSSSPSELHTLHQSHTNRASQHSINNISDSLQERRRKGTSRSPVPQRCPAPSTSRLEPPYAASTNPADQRPSSPTMASNRRRKKATIKRPSRLLNLNKSPQAQKLLYVCFYLFPSRDVQA